MCGIAGIVDYTGFSDEGLVESMCEQMVHRGPSARGIHSARDVSLGIRRLAIIDVAGGDQPLFSEDGQVSVVVNGEIYNFVELRERLRAHGHVFSSGSDAEVLVHLYEEYGDDCVEHLRGMFAFALWDARQRRVLLGRDRLGKKPLFYAVDGRRLIFASEMRALMADPSLDTAIDPRAVDSYFAFQYIPHPLSIFSAVRKLAPATLLSFDASGPRQRRYWRLGYEPKLEGIGEAEAAERLRAHLDEATRLRLMSDVPVGAFLSGGIDSSAVVASMANQVTDPVKTFCITFGEAAFDESKFARVVADRFETDHHEFRMEPDALSIMPRLARHYGEPYADPSAIPSFHLAALTGQHVTVALNGDGGDEAFGGYGRYLRMAKLQRLRRAPRPALAAAAWLGRAVGPGSGERDPRSRAARLGHSLIAPDVRVYGDSVLAFDRHRRERLLAPSLLADLKGWRAEAVLEEAWSGDDLDGVDRLLAADIETYLPGDLLVKMDIATMAHSVETRSPFLDHHFMEFAARLPVDLKLRGESGKHVLKTAMRGVLPDEILDRTKMGFGVPLNSWFRGQLAHLPREWLLDPAAYTRRYVVQSEVEQLLGEHASGSHDHALRIWTLVQFENWHREVLEPSRGLAGEAS